MKRKQSTTGEFELIAKLTEGVPRETEDILCGIGDDCAVIRGRGNECILVTTDSLIEGIHFLRKWTDPATLGHKVAAAGLSDIAAMGGMPHCYFVALGMPKELGVGGASALYSGMRSLADKFGAVLAGGDTSASRGDLFISIAVIGGVERERCLFRRGARPGDAVYVTGTLGAAALGLKCLDVGQSDERAAPFVRRHLKPVPRIDEGRRIAASGYATAMIDISDGLVADLTHIAQASGLGFEIESAAVPTDEGFGRLAKNLGFDPARLAMSGGEDYELLFTVSRGHIKDFEKWSAGGNFGCRLTRIGRMTKDAGACVALDDRGKPMEMECGGYDHFRANIYCRSSLS